MSMYYCHGCDYYHDSKGGSGYNDRDGKAYCDETAPEKIEYPANFDAWVIDQQEKSMRDKYQDYLDDCPTDIPAQEWPASAMSFDEFCSNYDPTEG